MASVALTRTWISLAADLTQTIVIDRHAGAQQGRSRSKVGEVRRYASGRLRAVNSAGAPGTVPLTFRTRDTDVVDALDSWAGQTVLVRDPRGRAEWGVFYEVSETDLENGYVEVSLTLTRVTYSIEV